jgi:opacity protein-like surface antigen
LTGTPDTDIDTSNALSPRSYSSFFITPGIKLKLLPGLRYSPFLAAGVGYARFNESDTLINNQPNIGDRGTNRAAYTIGGGLDVKVFPYLSLRGEVRDFYTGTPRFNADILDDRQHNFMVSTGLVLRF